MQRPDAPAATITPEQEIARLKHALSDCVPWVASSGRGKAQEALAVACHLLGIDPYDWTAHPDVLTTRRRLLGMPDRRSDRG